MPVPSDERERAVQSALRTLVENVGGRFGRGPAIPTPRDLTGLVDHFEAWVLEHTTVVDGDEYFPGQPGLWIALDSLYPLEDPNRWDRLRAQLLLELEGRGWHKARPPRGAGLRRRAVART